MDDGRVIERASLDARADENGELVLFTACSVCGAESSLLPDEGIVPQLRRFLELHRHES